MRVLKIELLKPFESLANVKLEKQKLPQSNQKMASINGKAFLFRWEFTKT